MVGTVPVGTGLGVEVAVREVTVSGPVALGLGAGVPRVDVKGAVVVGREVWEIEDGERVGAEVTEVDPDGFGPVVPVAVKDGFGTPVPDWPGLPGLPGRGHVLRFFFA